MKSRFVRFVCQVLTAGMIVLPWQAQAGLIGTDQALSAAQQRVAHATVAGFIDRNEVAAQLQLLGLSPQAARERIAALSDAEVAGLAGRIDALPAGGIAGVMPLIVVAVLLWWFTMGQPAGAKESAKPAAKPAPEKK
jgi:hypothetical protein